MSAINQSPAGHVKQDLNDKVIQGDDPLMPPQPTATKMACATDTPHPHMHAISNSCAVSMRDSLSAQHEV